MRRRKQMGSENVVGENITRLRLAAGMKQSELMAQLQVRGVDIGQASLSDLEGQNRAARDKEIQALADIFDVSIDQLFAPREKKE